MQNVQLSGSGHQLLITASQSSRSLHPHQPPPSPPTQPPPPHPVYCSQGHLSLSEGTCWPTGLLLFSFLFQFLKCDIMKPSDQEQLQNGTCVTMAPVTSRSSMSNLPGAWFQLAMPFLLAVVPRVQKSKIWSKTRKPFCQIISIVLMGTRESLSKASLPGYHDSV